MENHDGIFDDDLIRRILKEGNRPLNEKITNDRTVKEIGDRVVVLDYSSVTQLNGDELESYDDIDLDNYDYYIVIDTGKRVVYNTPHGRVYKQDLVIVNPKTNQQLRVTSRHTRLYVTI